MDLKDLVKGILTGDIQKDTLSKQQLEDVIEAIELMKALTITPDQQKKNKEKAKADNNARAFRDAKIDVPKGGPPGEEPSAIGAHRKPNLTVVKGDDCLVKSEETISWSSGGQWSLEKAIKPGPPLDYGKMLPEQNPVSNPAAAAAAKTKRYADIEANAPTMDYKGNRAKMPSYEVGAAEKAKTARAKAVKESQETALETFQRRGQTPTAAPKAPAATPAAPGTLTPTNKSLTKNEMMGYSGSSSMTMSEKEPHHDDPKHEKKEKKKAQDIKESAEEILSLHKAVDGRRKYRGPFQDEKIKEPLTDKEKSGITTRLKEVRAENKEGKASAPRKPGTEPPPNDPENDKGHYLMNPSYDKGVKTTPERRAITRAANLKALDDKKRKAAPKPKDIKDWF